MHDTTYGLLGGDPSLTYNDDYNKKLANSANMTMDYFYYGCSILLVASSIAIQVGTGVDVENLINSASYLTGLTWNYVDGVGAACIASEEDWKGKVAQFFNSIQLLTITTIVATETLAAPWASVSFALAMGITASTEYRNYINKKSEAEKLFSGEMNNQEEEQQQYNKVQREALEHRDAFVAYSLCTVAMGIVATGAFVGASVATGGVLPAVLLLAATCSSVCLSAGARYVSAKNKKVDKYNYNHSAIKKLEGIKDQLSDTGLQNIIDDFIVCIKNKKINSKEGIVELVNDIAKIQSAETIPSQARVAIGNKLEELKRNNSVSTQDNRPNIM